jgi:hypothetical protein
MAWKIESINENCVCFVADSGRTSNDRIIFRIDNWFFLLCELEGNNWAVHYPCSITSDSYFDRNYGTNKPHNYMCEECKAPMPDNFIFAMKMSK